MKIHNLEKHDHQYTKGMECPNISPNILEDTLFLLDNKPVGFFIKKLDTDICKIANFCNSELLSDRVPKSMMTRKDSTGDNDVYQYSTIIGAVPKKPVFRRHYNNISSVHQKKSAQNFIKGMIILSNEISKIIKKYLPEQYERQKSLILEHTPKELFFVDLFTSSISNFNICASFHIDNANIKNTVNAIVNKKINSTGGNLYVPDFNLCFDGTDNSLIVYPAWLSLHAVTPIQNTSNNGYRNSLVFYPLDLGGNNGK